MEFEKVKRMLEKFVRTNDCLCITLTKQKKEYS
jgi:hypothetical protein